MNQPQFHNFKYIEIKNFKTNEVCQMWRVDKMKISEEDYEQIRKICNEDAVYKFLFKDNLKGKPYLLEKAKGFIDWSKKGWKENTHFVFLVRRPDGKITACVDTKSNDLKSTEIGYWASEEYPGIMTNTVTTMIELDRPLGYKELYADVREDNPLSMKVVKRANFVETKRFKEKGRDYIRFTLKL